ncbi:xanthine dehydrogenase accessory protein XdhC [Aestuariibius sp. 2305UL40-4]|uniref:xanthine dehydrogenase accessory protein XdhC n=1 Tax=Aestuariibius violaceus TaxID=3234132 RepID=UPI00345E5370
MSFDLDGLKRAVALHGTVARVVVAETRGSVPREVGAAMLVWADGQSGTIGGGALEFEAARAARDGAMRAVRHPLGPALGQCCGGAVTLVTEVWDASSVEALAGPVVARDIEGRGETLAVRRARGHGVATFVDGWMIEPVLAPEREMWIWGAGHVGRALVEVLAPLPCLRIVWVDTDLKRFPETVPEGVTVLAAARPEVLVARAPEAAGHLVLTYSHALDLELCHRLLARGFARCGLIGSATKWARFRSRLGALGHGPEEVARIDCPIGDPALGKHPQAIAIGVAREMLAAPLALAGEKWA